MKIVFDKKEFEAFLKGIGCDYCQYYPELIDGNVIHNWESNIQGKITKYSDIELCGDLIQ